MCGKELALERKNRALVRKYLKKVKPTVAQRRKILVRDSVRASAAFGTCIDRRRCEEPTMNSESNGFLREIGESEVSHVSVPAKVHKCFSGLHACLRRHRPLATSDTAQKT